MLALCLIFLWLAKDTLQFGNLYSEYNQNDYVIDFKRVLVRDINENLVNVEYKTFKYNRTVTSFNGTLITYRDVQNCKAAIVGYKYSINEYKKTAIQLNVNVCTLLKMNFAGVEIVKTTRGNFTDCPLKQGTYQFYNVYFDSNKLPPRMFEGDWKFTANVSTNSLYTGFMELYVTITYPMKSKNP